MVKPLSIASELVIDCACALGEGPTWDSAMQRLLWLDIDHQILHRLDLDGQHSTLGLDRRVTAIVPTVGGGMVGAVDVSVARIDETGRVGSLIASLPPAGDGATNDARCDPRGRLWVGTVDRSGANRAGLFCVADDGSVTTVRGDVGLSNGLDWSPDGRVCHFVDSFARSIQDIHLDAEGQPIRTTTLVEFDATPDGLTVDREGGIWIALWDGGAVHRYRPNGTLDRIVTVPSGFVTSCALGGSGLTTLFITTARADMSAEELRQHPHAGGLFGLDVGIAGCGYTAFGNTAADS